MRSKKQRRGRPQEIPRNWVTGRAYNLAIQLKLIWPKLSEPLLEAETEEEVKAAFETYGSSYASNFVPERVSDVLALIRDRKLPKKKEAQIHFLADSLGGRPNLSLRRSRDWYCSICGANQFDRIRSVVVGLRRYCSSMTASIQSLGWSPSCARAWLVMWP